MYRTYFNTTDGPVIVGIDGRSIEGSTWGPADPDDERATTAIDAGLIVEIEQPGRDHGSKGAEINPDAAAAIQATKDLNKSTPQPAAEPTDHPKEP